MHKLLRKLGISNTIASVLMIVFGIAILVKPWLLTSLVAIYLIAIGILKLIAE